MWNGMLKNNPVLLDTHVWYWLMLNIERVNQPGILNKITRAQDNGNLYLSVISIWELGLLHRKKRLQLFQDINKWVDTALFKSHILLLPLHPEIALNSSILISKLHGDPADRILIASTLYLGATLITADKRLISYCKNQKLSCLSII